MTSYLRHHCRWGWTASIVILMFASLGSAHRRLLAQGQGQSREDSVIVGIEGHYRVGRWTSVRYLGPDSVRAIETRDGDGVQVNFRQDSDGPASNWNYAIPGGEAAPLILHGQDRVLASTRFPVAGSPSRGPSMIPLGMPWIIALGDPLGVDQIGANELLGRDAQIAVSMPEQAESIPDSVLGFDGVDMMILGNSSSPLLGSLTTRQQEALSSWITDGGRVFLGLGASAPQLLETAPWLRSLLPIDDIETVKINPAAIETFTSTQSPLDTFVGLKLPKDRGNVLIMGRTTRRVSTPLAAEYNVGFGRITVVAADLDDEMFASWPERLDLITRLTGSILTLEQDQAARRSRATAYDDLAGQMRATLDQFGNQRSFGFSIVSLILMALIAAIGPLDYLLINRVFGKPLLGWLTFPIVAIGLSVLLAAQAQPVSPSGQPLAANQLSCNRIEIVDIDAMEGVGREFTANYVYAHEATQFDFNVEVSPPLTEISSEITRALTTPLGYPGPSFGGIQIAIEDRRLPMYDVPSSKTRQATGSLMGVPLASRSSKGIGTRIDFRPKLVVDQSIEHRRGSELLQGALTNPLPMDLLDGMLVYRNWAYLLPTRFPAGDRIERIDTLRQKNFRWRLSRQKALESATKVEDWDPLQIDSPDRICEMLMFHDAVGGSRYTSMKNEPLSFLDLSHVLAADRCMLIGRVEKPFTEIVASGSDGDRKPDGQSLSLIRVVLPVDSSRR